MEGTIITIGDIAAEAYGYHHLIGRSATLYKYHPALPLALVDIEGDSSEVWISVADALETPMHRRPT